MNTTRYRLTDVFVDCVLPRDCGGLLKWIYEINIKVDIDRQFYRIRKTIRIFGIEYVQHWIGFKG